MCCRIVQPYWPVVGARYNTAVLNHHGTYGHFAFHLGAPGLAERSAHKFHVFQDQMSRKAGHKVALKVSG